MPFALGSSEVGSFPEIQISLPKQDVSSIFMPGSGTENPCKALSSSSPRMRKPAAFTGLRLGELRGLTWESYEPAQDQDSLGWLNVTRSIWRTTVGDPKTTKSKAPLPVIPQLALKLEEHRKRCADPKTGPIFGNSVGHPLDLNACYQKQMKDLLKRAGICWHGWHGFRRGLASNRNRLGVDDSVIQRILRHSTVATTQNHYIKTASPEAVAAMRQLSNALMCSTWLRKVKQRPNAPLSRRS